MSTEVMQEDETKQKEATKKAINRVLDDYIEINTRIFRNKTKDEVKETMKSNIEKARKDKKKALIMMKR